MAKPFDGYTTQEAQAIHQALIEQHLKSDANWPRLLADITTLMVDLQEGESVPGSVVSTSTVTKQYKTLITALDRAKQAYETLGARLQWPFIEGIGTLSAKHLPQAREQVRALVGDIWLTPTKAG